MNNIVNNNGAKKKKIISRPKFTSKRVRLIIYTIIFLLFVSFQILYTLSLSNNSFCAICHITSSHVAAAGSSEHQNLTCGSCHPGKGVSRYFSGEIKAISNLLLYPFGSSGLPRVQLDDNVCRNCHEDILYQTIKSTKVRIRHKDFLDEKTNCTDCHSGTGHKLKGIIYANPGMRACISCHNDTAASSDCSLCHVGRKKEMLAANLKVFGKFHPENYLYIHGSEKTDTCQICHENNFCSRCHVFVRNLDIDLPHPSSWIYTHWEKTSKENVQACYACHEKEKCDACHGLEMPHQNGFLKIHAQEADRYGVDKCLKCHDPRACSQCHITHVHPNFGTQWTPDMVLRRSK